MRKAILTYLFLSVAAQAHEARVEAVEARESGGSWSFSVTLSHAETGWDDYADGWRVEDEAGNILGERVLHHPHENEQPFTRSQSGIQLPEGLKRVFIRARTSVEGWGEERFEHILD